MLSFERGFLRGARIVQHESSMRKTQSACRVCLTLGSCSTSNENGDDTVMDDAQESQNGEQADELDETKLFLV